MNVHKRNLNRLVLRAAGGWAVEPIVVRPGYDGSAGRLLDLVTA